MIGGPPTHHHLAHFHGEGGGGGGHTRAGGALGGLEERGNRGCRGAGDKAILQPLSLSTFEKFSFDFVCNNGMWSVLEKDSFELKVLAKKINC